MMHRVRVWFGQTPIADYIGDDEHAERYAAAMVRRFPGLKITDDPLSLSELKPSE